MKCIKTEGGWINPALVKKYFVAKSKIKLEFVVFADDCPIKTFYYDENDDTEQVCKKAWAWLDDFFSHHNSAWSFFGIDDDNDDIK